MTKKIKEEENPVLEHGQWLATFLNTDVITKDGERKVERVIAGIYKTAQEGYLRATEYGDKTFWENPPETLALELFDFGVYPKCLKCQILCPFVGGIGYMDMGGFKITKNNKKTAWKGAIYENKI